MGPKASHWPTTITNNNSLPEPGGSTGNHWQQHGGRNRSYHHSTAAHSKSRNPHCRCNIFKLFPTCHPVAHPDSRHTIMQHQFLLRASLQHSLQQSHAVVQHTHCHCIPCCVMPVSRNRVQQGHWHPSTFDSFRKHSTGRGLKVLGNEPF